MLNAINQSSDPRLMLFPSHYRYVTNYKGPHCCVDGHQTDSSTVLKQFWSLQVRIVQLNTTEGVYFDELIYMFKGSFDAKTLHCGL